MVYLLISFLLFSYTCIICPFFLCSIKHVPGPYISKITSLWLTYHGYKNNSNQYIHKLHQIYGPVVRVAPGVVSFNSAEAINTIYGVRSDFPKPSSAASMDNYGKPNTFSSISNEDHRRRRSRYASSYSRSSMTQGSGYEGILKRTKQLQVVIHDTTIKKHSVDIYKIFHYYAIDNAAAVASGSTMGLLDGKNLKYSQDLRDMFKGLAYIFYFFLISTVLKMLPVSVYFFPELLLRAMEAHRRVHDQNLAHYMNSRSNSKPEFDKAVLVRLRDHKDYGSPDLTDTHIASEISDHLLAGADTLVAGLVYTLWELARPQHKAYLDRLIVEARSVEYTGDGHPVSYATIDNLVWLDCCIREGLRLHTPSGHIQSRIVPQGGAVISGYMIPEGTEVGVSLYSIQLNSSIFEDPCVFKPERWLEEENEPENLLKMKTAWMTFGHGARICVGKELALVQMKLSLAMILNRFQVAIDEVQTEDDMEGIQRAVLAPKGGRCLMRFSYGPGNKVS